MPARAAPACAAAARWGFCAAAAVAAAGEMLLATCCSAMRCCATEGVSGATAGAGAGAAALARPAQRSMSPLWGAKSTLGCDACTACIKAGSASALPAALAAWEMAMTAWRRRAASPPCSACVSDAEGVLRKPVSFVCVVAVAAGPLAGAAAGLGCDSGRWSMNT